MHSNDVRFGKADKIIFPPNFGVLVPQLIATTELFPN